MTRLRHPRFLMFLAVFVSASALSALWLRAESAVILGFDLAAGLFIASAVPLWRAGEADHARAMAARDDGGRLLLFLASGAVMAAILTALTRMIHSIHQMDMAQFAAVVGTLVMAWLFANLMFAFHYGQMFYDRTPGGRAAGPEAGGIQFPEGGDPVFADFVYFAFVIGMTCQTADLNIASRPIRRVATLHGLFAFFFNLGVLALSVNVLSGVL